MTDRPRRTRSASTLFLAVTAAAFLAPAPAPAQELDGIPPPLPVDRDELVRVVDDPEARVVDFLIGPLELPSGMAHLRLPIQMAEIPIDGWLHGFEAIMEDASGSPIPMETLHHVNFIDPDKRELFSPIARRVIAAGRETSKQQVPAVLGYPLQAGDRMLISSMFANPTETDFSDAFLRVRLHYSLEGDGMLEPRNVFPFYLDVMGPVGPKGFAVPPGRSARSWEGRPAVPGRILGIGGHLHDHASRLRLVDVATGTVLWEAEPIEDEDGRLLGVPTGEFWWQLGKEITPQHTYRIEVVYDNPLDVDAPDGGMGELGGVVWVGKDVAWPEFDREDPLYLADLERTLTAPERAEHGHGSHGGMEGMDPGMDAAEAMDHDAMDHGTEQPAAAPPADAGPAAPDHAEPAAHDHGSH